MPAGFGHLVLPCSEFDFKATRQSQNLPSGILSTLRRSKRKMPLSRVLALCPVIGRTQNKMFERAEAFPFKSQDSPLGNLSTLQTINWHFLRSRHLRRLSGGIFLPYHIATNRKKT
jgi:hypothetical protein